MNYILDRALFGLFLFVAMPCLIGIFILTLLVYIAAIDWMWAFLQAWWMT